MNYKRRERYLGADGTKLTAIRQCARAWPGDEVVTGQRWLEWVEQEEECDEEEAEAEAPEAVEVSACADVAFEVTRFNGWTTSWRRTEPDPVRPF